MPPLPVSDAAIAVLDLVAVGAAGDRRPFQLRLERPVPDVDGGWTCAARLDGLHARLAPAAGDDALQALAVALSLLAAVLREHVARGGRLEYATGDEFPLDAYFGWLGPSSRRSSSGW